MIEHDMRHLHLIYHELRHFRSSYAYAVESDAFRRQCALFSRICAQREADAAKPVVTFDDGHMSDSEIAQPLLDEFGLRAIFFVTAGWTGVRGGYMDWPQLRQLHAEGHQIGAHGLTHKLLTRCSDQELGEELGDAKKRLEDGLGSSVEMMSLPGGRMNRRVLAACREAGFVQVFTSVPKAEVMEQHPYLVGRLNVLGNTPVRWLEEVLSPKTGVLQQLQRTAAVKGALQRMLGDQLYARLWALKNHQEAEPEHQEAEPEKVDCS